MRSSTRCATCPVGAQRGDLATRASAWRRQGGLRGPQQTKPALTQCPPSCALAPADIVRRTLKLNDQIKQLAADLKDEQSCLMFGRGRNYATAMEAALKVGGQPLTWGACLTA